jgi:branched-chain amino acid transport system permease protein
MFAGTLVFALVNSFILILMAIGFNLTFGISGVANFAYGALYIMSAYMSWTMMKLLHLPFWASAALSVILTMITGAMMYRFVLLRVRGQALSEVIATFGIGLAILELFRYLGLVGFEYTLPVFSGESFMIGGAYLDMQRIAVVLIGLMLVLGLWLFTHFTSTGLAFRGIAQDERTALTFGIDSDRIATLSVSFGAGLAAIAATIIIPLGSIAPDEGYDVLMHHRRPWFDRRRDRGRFHRRFCGTLHGHLHRFPLDHDRQPGRHPAGAGHQALRPVRPSKGVRREDLER